MHKRAAAVSAAMLLLSSGIAARCEPLRCSNAESSRAISDDASARIVTLSQLFQREAKEEIDPTKVTATLSDSYEVGHGESTRDCHSRLAISYKGATVETEIDYEVIQTDEGKIITKWPRNQHVTPMLLMQLMMQVALAEQQEKASNAR